MAGFRSILAPVAPGDASLDAVGLGAALARQTGGALTLLHVIEVERSLPVTADMELESRRGEELLRRARARAEADGGGLAIADGLLQARAAGPAIVEEAGTLGADAIVLGVAGASPTGQFRVGRTAAHVLGHAPCAVCVVREPSGREAPDAETDARP